MDEDIGHLPGTKEEKFDPYMLPFINAMKERMGGGEFVRKMQGDGAIRSHLVGFMRSMTFHDSLVICDESQNLKKQQAKAVSTRLAFNSRMIFCGDWRDQCDIRGESGLKYLIDTIGQRPYSKIIEFTTADIYFPLIRDVVETFERHERSQAN
jgi:phosphate starvation-inducible protein PhoH